MESNKYICIYIYISYYEIIYNKYLSVVIKIKIFLSVCSTCYKSKLSKHLKICNAKITYVPEYINKGINLGFVSNLEDSVNSNKLELASIGTEEILAVIYKVNKLYAGNENIFCAKFVFEFYKNNIFSFSFFSL